MKTTWVLTNIKTDEGVAIVRFQSDPSPSVERTIRLQVSIGRRFMTLQRLEVFEEFLIVWLREHFDAELFAVWTWPKHRDFLAYARKSELTGEAAKQLRMQAGFRRVDFDQVPEPDHEMYRWLIEQMTLSNALR